MVDNLFQIFIHLDSYLIQVIQQYGLWTYPILFLVIFLETGVVVTPFLPGDSLLFAAGTIAAIGNLNVITLLLVISFAAILGDSVNYFIGHRIGRKVFYKNYRFLNKEYLFKAEKFYENHGAKTIFLARFIPILRTFAPFVAGVGKMDYGKFFLYNVAGAICWTGFFVLGGYFLGNIPFVKEHFSILVILIIVVSIIPLAIEFIKHKKN